MTVIYRRTGRANYFKRHYRDKEIFAVDSDIFTERLYIFLLTLPPTAALKPIKLLFLRPGLLHKEHRLGTW
jgi:hypothetical protein